MAKKGLIFVCVSILCSLGISFETLAAAQKVKPNAIKFSQSYAQKVVNDDGLSDTEGWKWALSGTIWDDFSTFDDTTPIQIVIGEFNTIEDFETLGEMKEYINKLDEAGKKSHGKYKIDTVKKKGTITYNWVFSYEIDPPENSNKDPKTVVKKSGSLNLTWNNQFLKFNVKVSISPLDFYFRDADYPGLPIDVEDLDEPGFDPNKPKPARVKKDSLGATFCQIRFGNKIYSNRGFGYSLKRKGQLTFKGPDKDSYFFNSHTIKEIKSAAILEEPEEVIPASDSVETSFGTPVDIDVLLNDTSFIEDDELSIYSISEQPLNGTVEISEDATSIIYTPGKFIGKDVLRYKVKDSLGRISSADARVVINVQTKDKNIPPFALNDVYGNAKINAPNIFSVLDNDHDLDGEKSDIRLVWVDIPESGKAKIEINENVIVYTPNPGYISEPDTPDSFIYFISDADGGLASARVDVYVDIPAPTNNPPIANTDSVLVQFNESSTLDLLANDSDQDEDSIQIVSYTLPDKGTVSLEDDEIIYAPPLNLYGTSSFQYTISDDKGGYATAIVNITINATPNAYDDVLSTNLNQSILISPLENDKDADGADKDLDGILDGLSIVSITNPSNGQAFIEVNAINYTPNNGFSGIDSFEYTISDENGGKSEGFITVFVGVPASNTPPVAVDDNLIVETDDWVNLNILDNDTDANNDTLRIMDIVKYPEYGFIDFSKGIPEYIPVSGYYGKDSFDYLISDNKGGTDTATVRISINSAPFAVDDNVQTDVNLPVQISVLENDWDLETPNDLTVIAVSNPANGTAVISDEEVVYTPNNDYEGTDRFTYTLRDGDGITSIGVINVTIK